LNKMKKIKLKIEGMHCSSCASNIEKSLKKLPAIKEVNVSLMLKKGTVELRENLDVSDEELKKAVSRVGYKITDIEKE